MNQDICYKVVFVISNPCANNQRRRIYTVIVSSSTPDTKPYFFFIGQLYKIFWIRYVVSAMMVATFVTSGENHGIAREIWGRSFFYESVIRFYSQVVWSCTVGLFSLGLTSTNTNNEPLKNLGKKLFVWWMTNLIQRSFSGSLLIFRPEFKLLSA